MVCVSLNTRFGEVSGTAGSVDNMFKIVEATGMGAARALATLAMSGGVGGAGGGIINASYGGGGAAGGGGGGGPINPGQHGWWTMDRQAHAVDVLMKGGVSEVGAKALVSRWMNVEASGGPSTVNSIGATGIGQWLGKRKIGLPSDFDGQIGHALKELHGSERRALGMLNSGSAAGAAAGASQFERAEGYNSRTGTDNFTARTLRGLGAVPGPGTPTVDGRPTKGSKTVQPGSPAPSQAGQSASADHAPIHIALHLDKKVIARHVVASIAAGTKHPTSVGGSNPASHYTAPATPLGDVA